MVCKCFMQKLGIGPGWGGHWGLSGIIGLHDMDRNSPGAGELVTHCGTSHAIWRQRFQSVLTQLMACCLMASNHHLKRGMEVCIVAVISCYYTTFSQWQCSFQMNATLLLIKKMCNSVRLFGWHKVRLIILEDITDRLKILLLFIGYGTVCIH